MENKSCNNCKYKNDRFINVYPCDKHEFTITYDCAQLRDFICDDWKEIIDTQAIAKEKCNFRKIK